MAARGLFRHPPQPQQLRPSVAPFAQPPAAFDPASGFPYQQAEDERFVQEQLWPEAIFAVQAWAIGPPEPPQVFNNTVPVNEPDLAPYVPVEDPSVQSWAIGPPQNAVADQSWNLDDGERFIQSQTWPDSTEVIPGYVPPTVQAWSVEGGEILAPAVEDPSVQAWPVGPPKNAVQLQVFTQPDETLAAPVVDDSIQPWPIQPPAVAAFDPAAGFPWAAEGGEVQAVPTPDDTAPAWTIQPPLNAVQTQAFNQPDETVDQPVDDPTLQAYSIQPPAAPEVNQLSAFGPADETIVDETVVDDTGQAYPIQPPEVAVFDPATGFPWAQEGGEVQAETTPDDTLPAWAVTPPQNAVQALAFNQPQDQLDENTEDPTTPALAVPTYIPGFPFNLDDSERFFDPGLADDNVGWAIGLVPANVSQAVAFNQPQDQLDATTEDPSIQGWLAPNPEVFFPPFVPGSNFPFNQDMSEVFVDQRWSFLWADLVNDWGDRSQVQVYPIPPNPVPPSSTLSPDPWFRRLQPQPGFPEIEAWSLYTSLIGRYGLAEGRTIYERMLHERKGPFQAGAKYDPDRHQPRPAIPHIEIPKARRN